MALTDRMKEARKARGLTQESLAKVLGVAKSTYTGYEKGSSEPNLLTLSRLMQALEVDANFLFQDELHGLSGTAATPRERENILKKYRRLDPYGQEAVDRILDVEWRRCSALAPAGPERGESEQIIYIFPGYSMPMSAGSGQPAGLEFPENYRLLRQPPGRASFIAPVSGDSMEPTYHDGEKLFIRSCGEIEVGQVGMFLMDGQQWVKELGEGVLISHNPAYAPVPMREDIRCQGLVLGVCDESYLA